MNQKTKAHPQKYLLWVALAGIIMMFAGLSSAFIVKRSQANWLAFNVPLIFYYSTAALLFSSVTLLLARRAFNLRQMSRYSFWLGVTSVLGILFITLQLIGFVELWDSGVTLSRNVSFAFLYVLVGIHAIHVLGGVIPMLVLFIKSLSRKNIIYSPVGLEIVSTYWHFVDLLWIYLLIFLVLEG